MEFGRVAEELLDAIDLSLPAEPAVNRQLLCGSPAPHPKIFIGCAKWGRPEWVGKLYPRGARERTFLQHYVQHYNSIELNITHHKLYGEPGVRNWSKKAAGRPFLFCPKMYKGITHKGKLQPGHPYVNEYFRGIAAFGEHLGPVLIQVSEKFSPKRMQELFNFLASLPAGFQLAMELRHRDWFQNQEYRTTLFEFLQERKIIAVITDAAGKRDCVHMQLTRPAAFIRFVGNSLHRSDYTRIDEWVQRIHNWLAQGLEELYFFMHMHDETYSPELTVYLVDQLNKHCGLNLLRPALQGPAGPDDGKPKRPPKRQWVTGR